MKDDSSTLIRFESNYINFNSSSGDSGFGFKNNGTLQYKNDGVYGPILVVEAAAAAVAATQAPVHQILLQNNK